MERTLLLLKPCTVQRRLIGEVINRIERKGLRIVGMKMMQLDDKILNEHYAHLTERPFFPWPGISFQEYELLSFPPYNA
jgi:nucleoside-diphosphate kinase